MSTITKQKKYRSQSRTQKASLSATYVILILLAILWLIPLVWIVLSAFRCEYQPDGTFIGRVTSNFFPKAYGLKNFKDLFTAENLSRVRCKKIKDLNFLRCAGNTFAVGFN